MTDNPIALANVRILIESIIKTYIKNGGCYYDIITINDDIEEEMIKYEQSKSQTDK